MNKMKDTVEMYDIWAKVDAGGTAILFPDGKHLKLVARIVNGQVIILEKDFFLEKRDLTKEESLNFINNSAKAE